MLVDNKRIKLQNEKSNVIVEPPPEPQSSIIKDVRVQSPILEDPNEDRIFSPEHIKSTSTSPSPRPDTPTPSHRSNSRSNSTSNSRSNSRSSCGVTSCPPTPDLQEIQSSSSSSSGEPPMSSKINETVSSTLSSSEKNTLSASKSSAKFTNTRTPSPRKPAPGGWI